MRRCACPCRQPLGNRRKDVRYIDHKHAQRAYRARVKARAEEAGLPASMSLGAIKATKGTITHNGDGPSARKPRKARREQVRIGYQKALDALAAAFPDAKPGLERALRNALTPRQRQLLDQKETPSV